MESQQLSELKDQDVSETNAAAWKMAEAAVYRVSNAEAFASELEEQASKRTLEFQVHEAELARQAAAAHEQQANIARHAEVKLRTQLAEEAARLRHAEAAVLDMHARTELFRVQQALHQQSYAAEFARAQQLAAGSAAISQSAVERRAAAAIS